MKERLWSAFKWILYFAFVAALIWGLPNFLSWKLNTESPIAAVTSGSMWPELHKGDLVIIQGVLKENIKVGDVVVWRTSNNGLEQVGFVIHRVVRINKNNLVTKGDANFNEDKPILFQNVVGKAIVRQGKILRIPYLGYMSIIGAKIKTKF